MEERSVENFEERLRKIQLRKNEARMKNYEAVIQESKEMKLPKNHESKKARAEWKLQQLEKKESIVADGGDYEQFKRLEETVTDIERREARETKVNNPDEGFSDFASAQLRQYQRLTRNLKPDLEQYQKEKSELGNEMFPTNNSLSVYTNVNSNSEMNVKRMTVDLEKQYFFVNARTLLFPQPSSFRIQVRNRRSRRRQFFEDRDVDFINERNRIFNETSERAYGKYTKNLKDNLERGTAL